MSYKEKLTKVASIMFELADTLDKSIEVDTAVEKLRQAGIVSTDEEIEHHSTKLASLSSDAITQTTELLIESRGREKSGSLGKPVINQPSNSGSDKYSGWHNRIMNLNNI